MICSDLFRFIFDLLTKLRLFLPKNCSLSINFRKKINSTCKMRQLSILVVNEIGIENCSPLIDCP